MTMGAFLAVFAAVLIIKMVALMYRVIKGPTVFDRVTGLGVMGTDTVVLILVLGSYMDRVDMFVDISLSYAILGFLGLLALAKYFEGKGDINL